MGGDALLRLENLSVGFPSRAGILPAVRDVNMTVHGGEFTCLVGESGCGKSLICKSILRLVPEYANLKGKIFFHSDNLLAMPLKKLRAVRGSRIGMIFQEPMTSLNPVLTVGEQTAEPLRLHLEMSKAAARQKVEELFAQVGIPAPENRYNDYPHQLSGGMRQRVMIAMALACGPDLLLADEPTTALDATIQGQILRLILHESQERGMAVLLITHDLGIVAEMNCHVGVMYAGILVEYAPADELFKNPMHPYTRGLIACAPDKTSFGLERLPVISGTVPALDEMPAGCPFAPRCPDAMPICNNQLAPAHDYAGHKVSCWLYALPTKA